MCIPDGSNGSPVSDLCMNMSRSLHELTVWEVCVYMISAFDGNSATFSEDNLDFSLLTLN
jgi:hypothetical protein